MEIFLKSSAAILVALILYLVLLKQGKDFSTILTIIVCSIVGIAAIHYLTPIIDLIYELQDLGNFDSQTISIILRCVGIGLIAEITATICADSGNGAMGKTLQLLATFVVIWLSLPLFTELLTLIKEILQKV